MNFVIKTILIILFFASANKTLQSQEQRISTVNQVIEIANEKNPIILISKLEAEQWQLVSDAAYEVPKIEIQASYGQMNTRTIDQNYEISQSFNPFVANAAKNLGKHKSAKSSTLLIHAKNDLRYHLRMLWSDFEFYHDKLNIISQKLALAEQHNTFAERQFQLGEIDQLAKMTIEIELAQIKQEQKECKIILDQKLTELKQVTGKEDIETDGLQTDEASLIEIDKERLAYNLEYEMIQQDIQIAKAERKYQGALRKPDLRLGYFVQSIEGDLEVNNQTIYYDRTPRFHGVTLGMELALFGKAYKANEKIADKNVKILEAKAAEIDFRTQNELTKLKSEKNIAKSNYEFYKKEILPKVDGIKNNLEKNFSNGEISFSDYEHGLNIYFESKEAYLQSIKDYNVSIYNLLYLLNK